MNVADMLALALTTRLLISIWFQEGGLFAGRRMYFEARGGLLGKLMTCPFCLATHATSWLALFTLGLPALLPEPWGEWIKASLYVMAAISVVHVLDRIWPVKKPVTFNSAETIPPEDLHVDEHPDLHVRRDLPGLQGVCDPDHGPQG